LLFKLLAVDLVAERFEERLVEREVDPQAGRDADAAPDEEPGKQFAADQADLQNARRLRRLSKSSDWGGMPRLLSISASM